MTESEAIVTRVEGDVAFVEVNAMASACGKCGDKGGCGKSHTGPRHYSLSNSVGARPGDAVIVSVPDGAVLKAAVLSYLMPLLFVLTGGAAGSAWGGEGLPAVAGAAIGLLVGLAVLRLFAQGREPWLTMRLKSHIISIDKEA